MSSFVGGVVGAVVGGITGIKGAKDDKDRLKEQAGIKTAEKREAERRLAIRLAQARRDAKRAEGARVAATAASGRTISGSALEVLADAAAEEAINREILKFEGETIISAKQRAATILTKERKRISPILAGIQGAAGGFATGADIAGILA